MKRKLFPRLHGIVLLALVALAAAAATRPSAVAPRLPAYLPVAARTNTSPASGSTSSRHAIGSVQSSQTSSPQSAFSTLNDYPWQGLASANGADGWGMLYGQCVSYAAWKAYEIAGGIQAPPFVPDKGWMPSDASRSLVRAGWPSAGGWASAAISAGIPVDTHPAVGDIAQWNYKGNGGTFPWGHVALVYAVNADGSINLAQYNLRDDSRFSTLHMPPGGAIDTSNNHSPFPVGWPDNFIHISGTAPSPAVRAYASTTLVTYADGSRDLIAVGKDGRMWHKWAAANGSWIDWNWFSSSTPFAPASPTLVKYADGSMDLIAVGSDGRMWHKWAPANGSWIDWNWFSSSTPFAPASPTLVKYADGSMDLIAVGNDGRMWHKWAAASGGWIDWNWFSSNTPFV